MSPVILNALRVYLSRTAVDFHRVRESFRRKGWVGGAGPPSPLWQLMKFEGAKGAAGIKANI